MHTGLDVYIFISSCRQEVKKVVLLFSRHTHQGQDDVSVFFMSRTSRKRAHINVLSVTNVPHKVFFLEYSSNRK
jgi:hypothetical protein